MSEQGFLKVKPSFATIAIHAGQNPDKWKSAAVVPPITTSTTYKQSSVGEHNDFVYSRSGNPTRNTLEECLAALDGGKEALTFASGLGAITTIVSLFSCGDNIICGNDIYGGTSRLFRVASRLGIEVTYTDFGDIENVKNAIRENTKMIWIETPTNPLLKVLDIAALAKLAKDHRLIVVVDNTFLTPYLQRPLDFGADIVMYSVTKYMNGHSDVVMGAAVVNDTDLAERLRYLQNTLGIIPSPIDCYMVNRSLKTLALRMERHKNTSLLVAEWIEKHPNVIQVSHPGLPSHPQIELSKRQTCGHSGVFSFKHNGGLEQSRRLLSSLKIFATGEGLGGHESLAGFPILMSHSSVPAEVKAKLGITDSLIRLSIGLEDADDLIQDLDQAFKATFQHVD